MIESIQKNKLITKLIKIISEKQRQLSKYKQHAKMQQQSGESGNNHYMIDQKIKEECNSTTLEVKAINAKLASLESQVSQLTVLLNEEININVQSIDKIQSFQQKEQRYKEKIQELIEKVKMGEEREEKMVRDNVAVWEENKKLKEMIESYKVEMEYGKLLEKKIEAMAKKSLQYQRFQQRIGQSIDAIYINHCHQSTKHSHRTNTPRVTFSKVQDLISKLSSIQNCLNDQLNFGNDNMLNQTIDGLSIIMQSFEDKLGEVACFTQRRYSGKMGNDKRASIWKEPQTFTCDGESEKTMNVLKEFKENINPN